MHFQCIVVEFSRDYHSGALPQPLSCRGCRKRHRSSPFAPLSPTPLPAKGTRRLDLMALGSTYTRLAREYFGKRGVLIVPESKARRGGIARLYCNESQRGYRVLAACIAAKYSRVTGISQVADRISRNRPSV